MPYMVVRNKMSHSEGTNSLTRASVWVASPVPIGRGLDDIDSIRQRIQEGRAFLKVVEYPWGVEFDVCDVEGPP